jgi:hypothetical protein
MNPTFPTFKFILANFDLEPGPGVGLEVVLAYLVLRANAQDLNPIRLVR